MNGALWLRMMSCRSIPLRVSMPDRAQMSAAAAVRFSTAQFCHAAWASQNRVIFEQCSVCWSA